MKEALKEFDAFLRERKLKLTGTVIGGTALIVLGIVDRLTDDVDILEPTLSLDLVRAVEEFSLNYKNKSGLSLRKDWINNGPASLKNYLPKGWQNRRVDLFKGQNITLYSLGRIDLLHTKLLAFCDRQEDYQDCLALKPSRSEILECLPWIADHDGNPDWPQHVKTLLTQLGKDLGYDLDVE